MKIDSNLYSHIQSESAIKYTLAHLFSVANIEYTNISISEMNLGKFCIVDVDGHLLKFSLLDERSLDSLLSGHLSLSNFKTSDGLGIIPIHLDPKSPFAEIVDSKLIIHAEILSLSFILLSRFEEILCVNRDKHDRFPFKESLAYKYDFIEYPLVDEYAMILRGYLEDFLPSKMLVEFTNKSKVIPSHDIDSVRRFNGVNATLKTLISDLIVDKSVATFCNSLVDLFKSMFNSCKDPYIKAIDILITTSEKYGLISEFYFMSAKKSLFNDGYLIDSPAVQQIINKIKSKNMLIGVHGGFETYKNYSVFEEEIKGIEQVSQGNTIYSRQHYLRIDVKHTFPIIERLGIKYDSSLGFAEREGFRCGTCHAYNPYNFVTKSMYNFREIPLIAMDTTLFGYRNLDNQEAYESLLKLYSRCLAVNGDFTLLWHNNSVIRERNRFVNVYLKFLKNNSKNT